MTERSKSDAMELAAQLRELYLESGRILTEAALARFAGCTRTGMQRFLKARDPEYKPIRPGGPRRMKGVRSERPRVKGAIQD